MSEKYNNSGSIFRNDKKTADTPTWADYTGSATIDGVEYWVSCWVKKSQSGKMFFSCTYRRKDNQPTTQPATELEKPIFPDTGEELPF